MAPAAIQAAVPISAWQPPTAPATQARFATTLPIPEAAKKPFTTVSLSNL